jgi:hypothetical protein
MSRIFFLVDVLSTACATAESNEDPISAVGGATVDDHNLFGQPAAPDAFLQDYHRKDGDKVRDLAVVMPNQQQKLDDDKDFEFWQVSIDDVEAMSTLDFFKNLDVVIEEDLERKVEPFWD